MGASMSEARPIIDEVNPAEAFDILRDDSATALIDVRTRAEWAFVGLPDIGEAGGGAEYWPIEWAGFPAMARNPGFVAEVMERLNGRQPGRLLFICRSGARSMAAAQTTAMALAGKGLAAHCTNVAEGFEGDLDPEGHRGKTNGWKARGLPWRQS
jgi:rhodanese-related sulfurtransferase